MHYRHGSDAVFRESRFLKMNPSMDNTSNSFTGKKYCTHILHLISRHVKSVNVGVNIHVGGIILPCFLAIVLCHGISNVFSSIFRISLCCVTYAENGYVETVKLQQIFLC